MILGGKEVKLGYADLPDEKTCPMRGKLTGLKPQIGLLVALESLVLCCLHQTMDLFPT